MENIIITIISILIQTLICSYFLTSFCQFIGDRHFEKKEILIHTIFMLLITIIRNPYSKHNSFS